MVPLLIMTSYLTGLIGCVSVCSTGIKTYTSIYSLQGDTLNKGNEHSVGLIAMNAVSSLGASPYRRVDR